MKHIAFILGGFTGSVIPLSKKLIEKGYKVDFFLCAFKSFNQLNHEALEISPSLLPLGMNKIVKQNARGLEDLPIDSYDLYIITHMGLGNSKNSFVKKMIMQGQRLYISCMVKRIKQKRHYDVYNVVGHDIITVEYSKKLKNDNIVHTFHEIYDHLNGSKDLYKSVTDIASLNIPIIVPSNFLKNRFASKLDSRCYAIPMGAFLSYRNFGKIKNSQNLPSNYLLFSGHILEYKGLSILVESIELLKQRNININVVIAGKGTDPLLNVIKSAPNYTIMNEWISNDDLADLVRNCKAIVCPYKSASQSGLPVLGYAFNKPTIATNVGAMSEYILEGKSGYLIDKDDAHQLADKIQQLYNTSNINEQTISQSIKTLGLDWNIIGDKYIKVLNEIFN